VASAETEAALYKKEQLDKERNRIESYALNEGIQMPDFSDMDDESQPIVDEHY
jgi:hypothetical protein